MVRRAEHLPVPTRSPWGCQSRCARQAMMSTATAAVNAAVQPAPAINQLTAVSTERTNTTGTNTEDSRSARRWTGPVPAHCCGDLREL